MIDLEPDFWGYVRSLGDPHKVAAKVSSANPTDCGSQENSAAGLSRCLIDMAHKYAPNTIVGFHLSCWDWQTNLQGCAKDYTNLGAQNADFLVADVSDRDAGWYSHLGAGGRIITIGSMIAERAPCAGGAAYAMTKAAIAGLVRGLARDLGPRDINVNNIQPGPTANDRMSADSPAADAMLQWLALSRIATPDEIAGLVSYLAGPEAGYITGACLSIDGGFTA
ncbi:SDR family oxidoreductase [Streptomyces mirabilis]|uniref:SDR family oxidoreductase n=1 Tax=Streptomyces mirabilis TaxID=68239 RepID=UPI0033252D75